MKKLLLILLCLPMIGFGQDDCGPKPKYSGSKFGTYKSSQMYKSYERKLKSWKKCRLNGDESAITYEYISLKLPQISKGNFNNVANGIKDLGYNLVNTTNNINSDKLLIFEISEVKPPDMWSSAKLSFKIYDSKKNLIEEYNIFSGPFIYAYPSECYAYYGKAILRCFEEKVQDDILINKSSNEKLSISSTDYEKKIRNYIDSNRIDKIEGIYSSTGLGGYTYKIAICKSDFKYNATIIETDNPNYNVGDIKMILEEASVNTIFSVKYFMANLSEQTSIANFENDALISFKVASVSANQVVGGDVVFYKLYPKLNASKRTRSNNGEWKGNGSGIIISKSGYIITNHHVIDDAEDIEVEFILNDEVQKFNAEIVQSDKVNDLAVIKIVDVNFDGVKELPYNFQTRSSDVGTKVYAYGYPWALSIMGKEIKVTDGIISSKTGFDGDITSYQISAPIQAGNSGGPLFDDKGNLIGINSSGIRKDLADNVGYAIKTSYVLNLIDILPQSIVLPTNKKLASLPLTEQIKEISKYVVLIKVK